MIKKTFFQGQGNFNDCIVCQEPIINPICPDCLSEQLKVWLSTYSDLSKRVMPKIQEYLNEIHFKEDAFQNLTTCVSCRNKKAAICPYCFTEFVFNLLKKLDVDKRILLEYLRFFNFDFINPDPHYAKDFLTEEDIY